MKIHHDRTEQRDADSKWYTKTFKLSFKKTEDSPALKRWNGKETRYEKKNRHHEDVTQDHIDIKYPVRPGI
jgi:hypothetical protein